MHKVQNNQFLDYFAPCMNQPFVDAKGLAERPVKPGKKFLLPDTCPVSQSSHSHRLNTNSSVS